MCVVLAKKARKLLGSPVSAMKECSIPATYTLVVFDDFTFFDFPKLLKEIF